MKNLEKQAQPLRFSNWRLVVFLGLILFMAGCAQTVYKEKSLQERLDYDRSVAELYKLDPQWWKIYGDDQLNKLVDEALRNNIDLAQAALNVNRALYQAKLLGADLVPSFSGGGAASASKNTTTGVQSVRSYGGDLGLSYELDLWQRLADKVSAKEWAYEATLEDRETARQALINSVVDAYYQWGYLNDSIKITEESLGNYRRLAGLTTEKHRAGKVAGVEPAQARQAVLSAENTLVDLKNQRQTALQTLRDLLNVKPGEVLPTSEPSILNFKPPEVDLNVPLSVLAGRPDLKAAEFRLKSSFKDLSAMEKSWFPTVTLGASLKSSSDHFRTALNVPFLSGVATLDLPFLQWNKVKWNVKISEADFETARLDFEKALTTALNEVDTYYVHYAGARSTLTNTTGQYAENLKISEYYRERYQAGAGELSDWLNALNNLYSSRRSLLQDRYQLVKYENMLYKAMGGRYRGVETVAKFRR